MSTTQVMLGLMIYALTIGPSTRAASAATIHWVGYQNGCMIRPVPTLASFNHTDNWYNYVRPGHADVATFGSGFNPQEHALIPNYIHMGSFCLAGTGCSDQEVPVDSTSILAMRVEDGMWTLHLGSGGYGCLPSTSDTAALSVANELRVGTPRSYGPTGPTQAQLVVQGGTVACSWTAIGDGSQGANYSGDLLFAGPNASLSCQYQLDVNRGIARFENGAGLTAQYARAGDGAADGETRALELTGAGTHATLRDHIAIGNGGSGSVLISEGALAAAPYLKMGDYSGTNNHLTVQGAGSTLALAGLLRGFNTGNVITIRDGARIHLGSIMDVYGNSTIAVQSGSEVRGDTAATFLYMRAGSFSVESGALFENAGGRIYGRAGDGMSVSVSGNGSRWRMASDIGFGIQGPVSAQVSGGGSFSCRRLNVPSAQAVAGGSGTLVVQGIGSSVALGESLRVGVGQPGSVSLEGGATLTATGIQIGTYGSLTAVGELPGLASEGHLSAGNPTGLLHVIGDLNLGSNSTLIAELAGLVAGSEHDRIEVQGAARLGGTLDLNLIDGFDPEVGTPFVVLTADTVIGAFAQLVPSDGSFSVEYDSDRVVVWRGNVLGAPKEAAEADRRLDLRISSANPLGSSRDLRLEISMPSATDRASIDVVDVQGRCVASFALGAVPSGSHALNLPLHGHGMESAGVYFLRLRLPGGAVTRKFVLAP